MNYLNEEELENYQHEEQQPYMVLMRSKRLNPEWYPTEDTKPREL